MFVFCQSVATSKTILNFYGLSISEQEDLNLLFCYVKNFIYYAILRNG